MDNITDSMVGLTLNSVINAILKRAVKKCFKCERSGYNSWKCPWKKKKKSKKSKKGKVNLATVDSDSDSGISSDSFSSDSSDSNISSSDSSDSDDNLNVHMAKIKKK